MKYAIGHRAFPLVLQPDFLQGREVSPGQTTEHGILFVHQVADLGRKVVNFLSFSEG
jgi:hypothetical protein